MIDSDSRLTQLGLLPVGPESATASSRAARMAPIRICHCPILPRVGAETLGVSGAKPYVALAEPVQPQPRIAVSLGVGEIRPSALPIPSRSI